MTRSKEIKDRLFECIHNGELENEDLLEIWSHIGNDILNLQTITSYKNKHKCAYNGVKFKKNLRGYLQKKEYIVDNE